MAVLHLPGARRSVPPRSVLLAALVLAGALILVGASLVVLIPRQDAITPGALATASPSLSAIVSPSLSAIVSPSLSPTVSRGASATPAASPLIWARLTREGCYVSDASSASPPGRAAAKGLVPPNPSVPGGVGPVELYGSEAGTRYTLAPAGWTCALDIGVSADSHVVVSPTSGKTSSSDRIEGWSSGGASYEAADEIACPWFAAAAQIYNPPVSTCGQKFKSPPAGTRVTRLSPTLIRYERKNTIGYVEFQPGAGGNPPFARSLQCSLPAARFQLCTAVYRAWIGR